ncbi:MAG: hypothetical protein ABIF71_10185 [Planctomycetota bacterium]
MSGNTRSFGWHGLACAVPAGWELGRETGNRQEGYVRLDDEYQPRLEVTWRKPRTYDIRKLYDNYTRNLKKRAGGDRARIQELRDFLSPAAGTSRIAFRWDREGTPVHEVITHCTGCRRLTFLRCIGGDEASPGDLAREVLGSFQDHTDGDWEHWGFLGLDYAVPDGMSLEHASLDAGWVRMDHGDRDDDVTIMMISMAGEHLSRGPLDAFCARALAADLAKYVAPVWSSGVIHGHPAVVTAPVAGRKGRLFPLFPVKGSLQIRGWHCPQRNKVFLVKTSAASAAGLARLDSVWEHVQCH